MLSADPDTAYQEVHCGGFCAKAALSFFFSVIGMQGNLNNAALKRPTRGRKPSIEIHGRGKDRVTGSAGCGEDKSLTCALVGGKRHSTFWTAYGKNSGFHCKSQTDRQSNESDFPLTFLSCDDFDCRQIVRKTVYSQTKHPYTFHLSYVLLPGSLSAVNCTRRDRQAPGNSCCQADDKAIQMRCQVRLQASLCERSVCIVMTILLAHLVMKTHARVCDSTIVWMAGGSRIVLTSVPQSMSHNAVSETTAEDLANRAGLEKTKFQHSHRHSSDPIISIAPSLTNTLDDNVGDANNNSSSSKNHHHHTPALSRGPKRCCYLELAGRVSKRLMDFSGGRPSRHGQRQHLSFSGRRKPRRNCKVGDKTWKILASITDSPKANSRAATTLVRPPYYWRPVCLSSSSQSSIQAKRSHCHYRPQHNSHSSSSSMKMNEAASEHDDTSQAYCSDSEVVRKRENRGQRWTYLPICDTFPSLICSQSGCGDSLAPAGTPLTFGGRNNNSRGYRRSFADSEEIQGRAHFTQWTGKGDTLLNVDEKAASHYDYSEGCQLEDVNSTPQVIALQSRRERRNLRPRPWKRPPPMTKMITNSKGSFAESAVDSIQLQLASSIIVSDTLKPTVCTDVSETNCPENINTHIETADSNSDAHVFALCSKTNTDDKRLPASSLPVQGKRYAMQDNKKAIHFPSEVTNSEIPVLSQCHKRDSAVVTTVTGNTVQWTNEEAKEDIAANTTPRVPDVARQLSKILDTRIPTRCCLKNVTKTVDPRTASSSRDKKCCIARTVQAYNADLKRTPLVKCDETDTCRTSPTPNDDTTGSNTQTKDRRKASSRSGPRNNFFDPKVTVEMQRKVKTIVQSYTDFLENQAAQRQFQDLMVGGESSCANADYKTQQSSDQHTDKKWNEVLFSPITVASKSNDQQGRPCLEPVTDNAKPLAIHAPKINKTGEYILTVPETPTDQTCLPIERDKTKCQPQSWYPNSIPDLKKPVCLVNARKDNGSEHCENQGSEASLNILPVKWTDLIDGVDYLNHGIATPSLNKRHVFSTPLNEEYEHFPLRLHGESWNPKITKTSEAKKETISTEELVNLTMYSQKKPRTDLISQEKMVKRAQATIEANRCLTCLIDDRLDYYKQPASAAGRPLPSVGDGMKNALSGNVPKQQTQRNTKVPSTNKIANPTPSSQIINNGSGQCCQKQPRTDLRFKRKVSRKMTDSNPVWEDKPSAQIYECNKRLSPSSANIQPHNGSILLKYNRSFGRLTPQKNTQLTNRTTEIPRPNKDKEKKCGQNKSLVAQDMAEAHTILNQNKQVRQVCCASTETVNKKSSKVSEDLAAAEETQANPLKHVTNKQKFVTKAVPVEFKEDCGGQIGRSNLAGKQTLERKPNVAENAAESNQNNDTVDRLKDSSKALLSALTSRELPAKPITKLSQKESDTTSGHTLVSKYNSVSRTVFTKPLRVQDTTPNKGRTSQTARPSDKIEQNSIWARGFSGKFLKGIRHGLSVKTQGMEGTVTNSIPQLSGAYPRNLKKGKLLPHGRKVELNPSKSQKGAPEGNDESKPREKAENEKTEEKTNTQQKTDNEEKVTNASNKKVSKLKRCNSSEYFKRRQDAIMTIQKWRASAINKTKASAVNRVHYKVATKCVKQENKTREGAWKKCRKETTIGGRAEEKNELPAGHFCNDVSHKKAIRDLKNDFNLGAVDSHSASKMPSSFSFRSPVHLSATNGKNPPGNWEKAGIKTSGNPKTSAAPSHQGSSSTSSWLSFSGQCGPTVSHKQNSQLYSSELETKCHNRHFEDYSLNLGYDTSPRSFADDEMSSTKNYEGHSDGYLSSLSTMRSIPDLPYNCPSSDENYKSRSGSSGSTQQVRCRFPNRSLVQRKATRNSGNVYDTVNYNFSNKKCRRSSSEPNLTNSSHSSHSRRGLRVSKSLHNLQSTTNLFPYDSSVMSCLSCEDVKLLTSNGSRIRWLTAGSRHLLLHGNILGQGTRKSRGKQVPSPSGTSLTEFLSELHTVFRRKNLLGNPQNRTPKRSSTKIFTGRIKYSPRSAVGVHCSPSLRFMKISLVCNPKKEGNRYRKKIHDEEKRFANPKTSPHLHSFASAADNDVINETSPRTHPGFANVLDFWESHRPAAGPSKEDRGLKQRFSFMAVHKKKNLKEKNVPETETKTQDTTNSTVYYSAGEKCEVQKFKNNEKAKSKIMRTPAPNLAPRKRKKPRPRQTYNQRRLSASKKLFSRCDAKEDERKWPVSNVTAVSANVPPPNSKHKLESLPMGQKAADSCSSKESVCLQGKQTYGGPCAPIASTRKDGYTKSATPNWLKMHKGLVICQARKNLEKSLRQLIKNTYAFTEARRHFSAICLKSGHQMTTKGSQCFNRNVQNLKKKSLPQGPASPKDAAVSSAGASTSTSAIIQMANKLRKMVQRKTAQAKVFGQHPSQSFSRSSSENQLLLDQPQSSCHPSLSPTKTQSSRLNAYMPCWSSTSWSSIKDENVLYDPETRLSNAHMDIDNVSMNKKLRHYPNKLQHRERRANHVSDIKHERSLESKSRPRGTATFPMNPETKQEVIRTIQSTHNPAVESLSDERKIGQSEEEDHTKALYKSNLKIKAAQVGSYRVCHQRLDQESKKCLDDRLLVRASHPKISNIHIEPSVTKFNANGKKSQKMHQEESVYASPQKKETLDGISVWSSANQSADQHLSEKSGNGPLRRQRVSPLESPRETRKFRIFPFQNCPLASKIIALKKNEVADLNKTNIRPAIKKTSVPTLNLSMKPKKDDEFCEKLTLTKDRTNARGVVARVNIEEITQKRTSHSIESKELNLYKPALCVGISPTSRNTSGQDEGTHRVHSLMIMQHPAVSSKEKNLLQTTQGQRTSPSVTDLTKCDTILEENTAGMNGERYFLPHLSPSKEYLLSAGLDYTSESSVKSSPNKSLWKSSELCTINQTYDATECSCVNTLLCVSTPTFCGKCSVCAARQLEQNPDSHSNAASNLKRKEASKQGERLTEPLGEAEISIDKLTAASNICNSKASAFFKIDKKHVPKNKDPTSTCPAQSPALPTSPNNDLKPTAISSTEKGRKNSGDRFDHRKTAHCETSSCVSDKSVDEMSELTEISWRGKRLRIPSKYLENRSTSNENGVCRLRVPVARRNCPSRDQRSNMAGANTRHTARPQSSCAATVTTDRCPRISGKMRSPPTRPFKSRKTAARDETSRQNAAVLYKQRNVITNREVDNERSYLKVPTAVPLITAPLIGTSPSAAPTISLSQQLKHTELKDDSLHYTDSFSAMTSKEYEPASKENKRDRSPARSDTANKTQTKLREAVEFLTSTIAEKAQNAPVHSTSQSREGLFYKNTIFLNLSPRKTTKSPSLKVDPKPGNSSNEKPFQNNSNPQFLEIDEDLGAVIRKSYGPPTRLETATKSLVEVVLQQAKFLQPHKHSPALQLPRPSPNGRILQTAMPRNNSPSPIPRSGEHNKKQRQKTDLGRSSSRGRSVKVIPKTCPENSQAQLSSSSVHFCSISESFLIERSCVCKKIETKMKTSSPRKKCQKNSSLKHSKLHDEKEAQNSHTKCRGWSKKRNLEKPLKDVQASSAIAGRHSAPPALVRLKHHRQFLDSRIRPPGHFLIDKYLNDLQFASPLSNSFQASIKEEPQVNRKAKLRKTEPQTKFRAELRSQKRAEFRASREKEKKECWGKETVNKNSKYCTRKTQREAAVCSPESVMELLTQTNKTTRTSRPEQTADAIEPHSKRKVKSGRINECTHCHKSAPCSLSGSSNDLSTFLKRYIPFFRDDSIIDCNSTSSKISRERSRCRFSPRVLRNGQGSMYIDRVYIDKEAESCSNRYIPELTFIGNSKSTKSTLSSKRARDIEIVLGTDISVQEFMTSLMSGLQCNNSRLQGEDGCKDSSIHSQVRLVIDKMFGGESQTRRKAERKPNRLHTSSDKLSHKSIEKSIYHSPVKTKTDMIKDRNDKDKKSAISFGSGSKDTQNTLGNNISRCWHRDRVEGNERERDENCESKPTRDGKATQHRRFHSTNSTEKLTNKHVEGWVGVSVGNLAKVPSDGQANPVENALFSCLSSDEQTRTLKFNRSMSENNQHDGQQLNFSQYGKKSRKTKCIVLCTEANTHTSCSKQKKHDRILNRKWLPTPSVSDSILASLSPRGSRKYLEKNQSRKDSDVSSVVKNIGHPKENQPSISAPVLDLSKQSVTLPKCYDVKKVPVEMIQVCKPRNCCLDKVIRENNKLTVTFASMDKFKRWGQPCSSNELHIVKTSSRQKRSKGLNETLLEKESRSAIWIDNKSDLAVLSKECQACWGTGNSHKKKLSRDAKTLSSGRSRYGRLQSSNAAVLVCGEGIQTTDQNLPSGLRMTMEQTLADGDSRRASSEQDTATLSHICPSADVASMTTLSSLLAHKTMPRFADTSNNISALAANTISTASSQTVFEAEQFSGNCELSRNLKPTSCSDSWSTGPDQVLNRTMLNSLKKSERRWVAAKASAESADAPQRSRGTSFLKKSADNRKSGESSHVTSSDNDTVIREATRLLISHLSRRKLSQSLVFSKNRKKRFLSKGEKKKGEGNEDMEQQKEIPVSREVDLPYQDANSTIWKSLAEGDASTNTAPSFSPPPGKKSIECPERQVTEITPTHHDDCQTGVQELMLNSFPARQLDTTKVNDDATVNRNLVSIKVPTPSKNNQKHLQTAQTSEPVHLNLTPKSPAGRENMGNINESNLSPQSKRPPQNMENALLCRQKTATDDSQVLISPLSALDNNTKFCNYAKHTVDSSTLKDRWGERSSPPKGINQQEKTDEIGKYCEKIESILAKPFSADKEDGRQLLPPDSESWGVNSLEERQKEEPSKEILRCTDNGHCLLSPTQNHGLITHIPSPNELKIKAPCSIYTAGDYVNVSLITKTSGGSEGRCVKLTMPQKKDGKTCEVFVEADKTSSGPPRITAENGFVHISFDATSADGGIINGKNDTDSRLKPPFDMDCSVALKDNLISEDSIPKDFNRYTSKYMTSFYDTYTKSETSSLGSTKATRQFNSGKYRLGTQVLGNGKTRQDNQETPWTLGNLRLGVHLTSPKACDVRSSSAISRTSQNLNECITDAPQSDLNIQSPGKSRFDSQSFEENPRAPGIVSSPNNSCLASQAAAGTGSRLAENTIRTKSTPISPPQEPALHHSPVVRSQLKKEIVHLALQQDGGIGKRYDRYSASSLFSPFKLKYSSRGTSLDTHSRCSDSFEGKESQTFRTTMSVHRTTMSLQKTESLRGRFTSLRQCSATDTCHVHPSEPPGPAGRYQVPTPEPPRPAGGSTTVYGTDSCSGRGRNRVRDTCSLRGKAQESVLQPRLTSGRDDSFWTQGKIKSRVSPIATHVAISPTVTRVETPKKSKHEKKEQRDKSMSSQRDNTKTARKSRMEGSSPRSPCLVYGNMDKSRAKINARLSWRKNDVNAMKTSDKEEVATEEGSENSDAEETFLGREANAASSRSLTSVEDGEFLRKANRLRCQLRNLTQPLQDRRGVNYKSPPRRASHEEVKQRFSKNAFLDSVNKTENQGTDASVTDEGESGSKSSDSDGSLRATPDNKKDSYQTSHDSSVERSEKSSDKSDVRATKRGIKSSECPEAKINLPFTRPEQSESKYVWQSESSEVSPIITAKYSSRRILITSPGRTTKRRGSAYYRLHNPLNAASAVETQYSWRKRSSGRTSPVIKQERFSDDYSASPLSTISSRSSRSPVRSFTSESPPSYRASYQNQSSDHKSKHREEFRQTDKRSSAAREKTGRRREMEHSCSSGSGSQTDKSTGTPPCHLPEPTGPSAKNSFKKTAKMEPSSSLSENCKNPTPDQFWTRDKLTNYRNESSLDRKREPDFLKANYDKPRTGDFDTRLQKEDTLSWSYFSEKPSEIGTPSSLPHRVGLYPNGLSSKSANRFWNFERKRADSKIPLGSPRTSRVRFADHVTELCSQSSAANSTGCERPNARALNKYLFDYSNTVNRYSRSSQLTAEGPSSLGRNTPTLYTWQNHIKKEFYTMPSNYQSKYKTPFSLNHDRVNFSGLRMPNVHSQTHKPNSHISACKMTNNTGSSQPPVIRGGASTSWLSSAYLVHENPTMGGHSSRWPTSYAEKVNYSERERRIRDSGRLNSEKIRYLSTLKSSPVSEFTTPRKNKAHFRDSGYSTPNDAGVAHMSEWDLTVQAKLDKRSHDMNRSSRSPTAMAKINK